LLTAARAKSVASNSCATVSSRHRDTYSPYLDVFGAQQCDELASHPSTVPAWRVWLNICPLPATLDAFMLVFAVGRRKPVRDGEAMDFDSQHLPQHVANSSNDRCTVIHQKWEIHVLRSFLMWPELHHNVARIGLTLRHSSNATRAASRPGIVSGPSAHQDGPTASATAVPTAFRARANAIRSRGSVIGDMREIAYSNAWCAFACKRDLSATSEPASAGSFGSLVRIARASDEVRTRGERCDDVRRGNA